MPMPSKNDASNTPKQGVLQYAKVWGESPLPPITLASLIFAQTASTRPLPKLPLVFPPVLLLASYLSVSNYKTDAAGITSAWSAAYLVLARRRKQALGAKFGVRGLVRGGTLGLCLANVVGGGVAWAFGEKTKDV